MRFLILQDIPEGTDLEIYSIAHCFMRALLRAGHTPVVINTKRQDAPKIFTLMKDTCDVLFITQNYFLDQINYIKDFNGLKVFWSIDSHKDFVVHVNFITAMEINITLVAGYNYLHSFMKHKINPHYFPNCYPSDLIQPIEFKNRLIDIGFCGSKSNRNEWLSRLALEFNMHLGINQAADQMVANLNSYRISWNRNESDDLNFRTFESTGAGAALLSQRTGGIEYCFAEDEYIGYNDIDECIDKAKYYINHESLRLNVALKGYQKARNYHSFDSRTTELIKIIEIGE